LAQAASPPHTLRLCAPARVSPMSTAEVARFKYVCCAGCCVGWLITIIVLIASSLKTLQQGEYALQFSHWDQDITGEVMLEPGIKNVGPLNKLVRYPSVYQMVYFDSFSSNSASGNEVVLPPVHSRTFDGLQVYVKISFQWKLEPQHLKSIYGVLGGGEDILDMTARPDDKPSFVSALVRFARGTLTNVCSNYTAAQFFANQTLVEQTMLFELTKAFNQPQKGLQIAIRGLQLRSVDLPDAYEGSIADTQKEEQDFQTALAERATRIMQMERRLMQAGKLQEELRVDALGNVTAIQEENAALVQQYSNFQVKQADVYAVMLQSLVNTNDPFKALIELMRQKALKAHATNKVTLSM